MKHAIASFIFVASIAGFGGVANALPIIYATDGDPSKNVALEQDVDNFIFRGGSIALDQGANQWIHRTEAARGEAAVATIRWHGYTDNAEVDKLALDQGANKWNHRDDDSRVNPRLVL